MYVTATTRKCQKPAGMGCADCNKACPCKNKPTALGSLGFNWGGLFTGVTNAAATVAGSNSGKVASVAAVINKIAAPIAQTALAVQGAGNQQVQLQYQPQSAVQPQQQPGFSLSNTVGGVPLWAIGAGGAAALALVLAVAKR